MTRVCHVIAIAGLAACSKTSSTKDGTGSARPATAADAATTAPPPAAADAGGAPVTTADAGTGTTAARSPAGCDLTGLGLAKATPIPHWTPPAGCSARTVEDVATIDSEQEFAAGFACTGGAGSGIDFKRNLLVVQRRTLSPAGAGGELYDDGKTVTFVNLFRTPCPDDPRPMPVPYTVTFLLPAGSTRGHADASCTIHTRCR